MYLPICVGHIPVSLQIVGNKMQGVHLVPSNVESVNCVDVQFVV